MGLNRTPLKVSLKVKGFQEAQDRNRRRIKILQPGGIQGILQNATLELQQWAVFITPVDTGTWQASHRIKMETNRGMVFLKNNINPKSGTRVWDYAEKPELPGHGPAHDVYKKTAHIYGPRVLQKAAKATAKKIEIT